ncbi:MULTISPECIES: hypothetical protein [unclassified Saccharopolyspora]|uniref:hypothetical protein n=1 Tax=unclassified Saccharopolyspora TaxID=2646250 RepID=UPI001CD6B01F|nr:MULTISPECIES: hypothetical protein [unclassified Saccharopolyspora]MCA1188322.1 hypothetical protein [Saccharopolyspora sp. 6T]MCA1193469.1 hypothetical protein [Saccharopolyspora sp. 6V]MCA1280536.1 hypothetical protein [Saccharopolyspora sp. 7B]
MPSSDLARLMRCFAARTLLLALALGLAGAQLLALLALLAATGLLAWSGAPASTARLRPCAADRGSSCSATEVEG